MAPADRTPPRCQSLELTQRNAVPSPSVQARALLSALYCAGKNNSIRKVLGGDVPTLMSESTFVRLSEAQQRLSRIWRTGRICADRRGWAEVEQKIDLDWLLRVRV